MSHYWCTHKGSLQGKLKSLNSHSHFYGIKRENSLCQALQIVKHVLKWLHMMMAHCWNNSMKGNLHGR